MLREIQNRIINPIRSRLEDRRLGEIIAIIDKHSQLKETAPEQWNARNYTGLQFFQEHIDFLQNLPDREAMAAKLKRFINDNGLPYTPLELTYFATVGYKPKLQRLAHPTNQDEIIEGDMVRLAYNNLQEFMPEGRHFGL